MLAKIYNVYLYPPRYANGKLGPDPAPAIGSGLRRVVARIGRKHVHLETAGGRKARLRIEIWDALRKEEESR